MDTDRAIEVVTKLANGVDPYTNERIDDDSPYQNADTVRALNVALDVLRNVKGKKPIAEGPGKAGKAWSEEEEASMAEMFDAKVNVVEIAEKLERTKGAIWARLEKMGKVTRDENGKVSRVSAAPVQAENQQEAQPEPAGCEF